MMVTRGCPKPRLWERWARGCAIAVFLCVIRGDFATAQGYCAGNARSLTYAIDTTASMTDDIAQVCAHTQQIANTLVTNQGNLLRSFILVPFNDPDYGPVRLYSTPQELTAASCGLSVSDGGDCEEKSLSGLVLALGMTCPRSTVFVFTDATAKDFDKLGVVLELVEQRQLRVVFVLSGNCGEHNSAGYRVYETIAERSGGIVFVVSKTEVSAILAFAARTFTAGPNGLLLYRLIDRAFWMADFLVGARTQSLSVAVSCASGNPSVTLSSPNRADTRRAVRTATSNSVLYNIAKPASGRWGVRVTGAVGCTISISAVSTLAQAFQFYFSPDQTSNPDSPEVSTRPVQGQRSYIFVATRLDTRLSQVDLVSVSGRSIVRLTNVVFRNDSYVVFGPFQVPRESFFIQFTGTQQPRNQQFVQLSITMVSPQPGDVLREFDPSTVVSEYAARLCSMLELTCSTTGQRQQVIWSHNGTVVSPDGSHIRIHGERQHHLRIYPVQHRDAGRYTCQTVDTTNRRSQTTALLVRVQDLSRGRFNRECDFCQVITCPSSVGSTTWRYNNAPIVSDGRRYQMHSNGTIRICLPLDERQGVYQCTTRGNIWYFTISVKGVLRDTAEPTTFGEPPTPAVVQCGAAPVVQNGRREVSGVLSGSTAVYRCDRGYRLVGVATVMCSGVGAWGSPPACRALTCARLARLQHGATRYLISPPSVGSYLIYSCDAGFRMAPGRGYRQCLPDGNWSGEAVLCLGTCSHPGSPQFGSVVVSGDTPGSRAVFSCNAGRLLTGGRVASCTNAGRWSSPRPVCAARSCPALSPPTHGRLSSTLTRIGVRVVLTCDRGHFLSTGTPVMRECRIVDGRPQWMDRWTGPAWQQITCVSICAPLRVPANGLISSNERTPGTMVYLTCRPGYRRSVGGSVAVYCSATNGRWQNLNGRWDHVECVAVQCMPLVAPIHGTVSATGRQVGAAARYDCDVGRDMVPTGFAGRVCLPNGTWSGTPPRCQVRQCPSPPDVDNARALFTTTTEGSGATYACLDGYKFAPTSPAGPSPRRAVVMCHQGDWQGSIADCIPKRCPVLPAIADGLLASFSGRQVGGVATYVCNPGFRVQPPSASTLTCSENETWTGQPARCIATSCAVPKLDNGKYGRRSSSPGEVRGRADLASGPAYPGEELAEMCDVGYRSVVPSSLFCDGEGRWQGAAARCEAVDCGPPPRVANGTVASSGTALSAHATYKCHDDCFRLSGPPTVTCTAAGTWSATNLTCTATTSGSCTAPTIVFTTRSQSVFQSPDGCVLMACRAQDGGVLPVTRQWYRDGSMVRDGGAYRVMDDGLKICGARPETHAGLHTCRVSNRIGFTTKNFTLPPTSCTGMWVKEIQADGGIDQPHTTPPPSGSIAATAKPSQQCNDVIRTMQATIDAQARRMAELKTGMKKMEAAMRTEKSVLAERVAALSGNLTECGGKLRAASRQSSEQRSCCRQAAEADIKHSACQKLISRMRELMHGGGVSSI